MQRKWVILALAMLTLGDCFAQGRKSNFRRKVSEVAAAGWYSLTLPGEMHGKTNSDFSDIRIYRLENGDTVEAPYLLKIREDDVRENALNVRVLNESRKGGSLFVTCELEKNQEANSIQLEFAEKNFDGYVRVDGSNDQLEWFTLKEHQRILSIANGMADYSFTTVTFPESKYRYLRVQSEANTQLHFVSAAVKKKVVSAGSYTDIPLKWKTKENPKYKSTEAEINFLNARLVNTLKIGVKYEGDYYRPFTLSVLRDSFMTSNGWQFRYEQSMQGTLTSAQPNDFTFQGGITKKMKLEVRNGDNQPLSISNLTAEGPDVTLTTKLSPGLHFLFYGNATASTPSYDLKYFTENIPTNPPVLTLGNEEDISVVASSRDPLFAKKIWLWAVMGAVILVLGFFTRRLMTAKSKDPVAKD